MATPHDPTTPHGSLDAVIAAYMLAVEAGEVPNRQELLGRHPEHAEWLRSFFTETTGRSSASPRNRDSTWTSPRRRSGPMELLERMLRILDR